MEACKLAVIPDGALLAEKHYSDALKKDMSPSVFAVARERVTASAEFGHVGNLRVCFKGNRYIVAASTQLILEHISASGGGPADLPKAYHWLRTVTLDGHHSETLDVRLFANIEGAGV